MLHFDEKADIMLQVIFGYFPQEKESDVAIRFMNHSKDRERVEEDMDNIDIFDAAKYMVCLYYKADKLYTCSRTKIEKLLAIADLIFIKHAKRLFPQLPIYINSCGIGYRVLSTNSFLFPIDNIISGECQKEFADNITIKLNAEQVVPQIYEIEFPEENARKVLEGVFCHFGAYTAKLIGSTIDDFKEQLQYDGSISDMVNIEKAKDFFSQGNEVLKTNNIAKFIAEYNLEL